MSLLDQPPVGPSTPSTGPTTPPPPPDRRPRRKGLIILAVVVIAALAFVIGRGTGSTVPNTTASSGASTPQTTPATVQMPNVTGMTVDAAISRLKVAVGAYNMFVADGEASRYKTITSFSPPAGTIITAGTRIDFYVTPSYTPSYSTPSYSAPTYSAPSSTTSPSASGFGSGTWEVGNDVGEIPPGTYRAAAGSSRCYYERLSSLDGDFGSIITNEGEYDGGPMIVTISGSDAAFKVSGDCRFVRR